MYARFYARLWREECEKSRFWISTTMASGFANVLLVGALMYCLARYAV